MGSIVNLCSVVSLTGRWESAPHESSVKTGKEWLWVTRNRDAMQLQAPKWLHIDG